MVIVNDATNNFDVNAKLIVSIEYKRIPSRILQYSKIHTNLDDNRLT
jgi:hypothetical protein